MHSFALQHFHRQQLQIDSLAAYTAGHPKRLAQGRLDSPLQPIVQPLGLLKVFGFLINQIEYPASLPWLELDVFHPKEPLPQVHSMMQQRHFEKLNHLDLLA